MLLAIDIGNSNIVIGVCDDGRWRSHWRVQSAPDKTSDQYRLSLRGLLEQDHIPASGIQRVVLSSVVPSLTQTLKKAVSHTTEADLTLVDTELHLNIRIDTEHPAEVGSDLIANAVAAYDRYRTRTIVADFGTALTFTAVDEHGVFRGVAIAPGLQTAARALSQSTAQLPEVELSAPARVTGRTTTEALQAGTVMGFVGLVERIIGDMNRELGGNARVVATGGLVDVMAPLSGMIHEVDHWLTLEGLRILAELNPVSTL